MTTVDWAHTLSPADFELLVERLIWRFGFFNVRRLGGPGDRGRDLVATTHEAPLPTRTIERQWIVQCKRYAASPSKGNFQEEFAKAREHHPDYHLTVGTFDLTSDMHDWLRSVAPEYRFEILVVTRDELHRWLASAPDVTAEFVPTDGTRPFAAFVKNAIIGVEAFGAIAGPAVTNMLSSALTLAFLWRHTGLSSLHLLAALVSSNDGRARRVLELHGVTAEWVLNVAAKVIPAASEPPSSLDIRDGAHSALGAAAYLATKDGSRIVDDMHLLQALTSIAGSGATELLLAAGLTNAVVHGYRASGPATLDAVAAAIYPGRTPVR